MELGNSYIRLIRAWLNHPVCVCTMREQCTNITVLFGKRKDAMRWKVRHHPRARSPATHHLLGCPLICIPIASTIAMYKARLYIVSDQYCSVIQLLCVPSHSSGQENISGFFFEQRWKLSFSAKLPWLQALGRGCRIEWFLYCKNCDTSKSKL